MLRRRLLITFGALVILLAALAGPTIWGLQRVLAGLDRVNTEARGVVDQVAGLNMTLTSVEVELYRLQLGRQEHLDTLIVQMKTAGTLIDGIGRHRVVHEPGIEPFYRELAEAFPGFMRQVSSLATAQDPDLARQYNVEALSTAMAVRENVGRVYRMVAAHARGEEAALVAHFRWLVVGIALGCLLVITVSIIVLLHAANMVLGPLTELVQTSRRLTDRSSEDRFRPAGADEFAQLAEAYRDLGKQLEAQEQRRMETLRQTAVALNHELNTAMTGIELQLEVIRQQAGSSEQFEACLRTIRGGIRRMAETVESLKHIQQIVVTDYLAGIKMLDLKRSTQARPPRADATPGP